MSLGNSKWKRNADDIPCRYDICRNISKYTDPYLIIYNFLLNFPMYFDAGNKMGKILSENILRIIS